MNKRSFFKSLALLAGAASIFPQVFIPKFEPVRWKRTRQILKINPDWIDAPYEVQHSHMILLKDLCGKWNFIQHPDPSLPVRYVLDHDKFVYVRPYIIENHTATT